MNIDININVITVGLAIVYLIAVIIAVVMISKLLKDDKSINAMDNLRDEEC